VIDNYFDKIFYINLKRDVVRNSRMLEEFRKYNINNFERVDGVMYDSISDRNLWRNFNKSEEKYVIGSLGCRDSHLKVISLAKERKYKRVLILEDDIRFIVNPNKLLFPNIEWDMLYLGGAIESYFRNQIVGGYAYGISERIHDDILNMAIPSGMEIDNFYAKILQHMSLNSGRDGQYDVQKMLPFPIEVDLSITSNIR
jgi:hypothetical protein